MLDSHHHLWDVSRGDYGWMGDHVRPLLRDFRPEDLAPLLKRTGVTRTILVQAAETDAETDFLLSIAERTDFVAGVVGWADLENDDFSVRLAALRRNRLLVGLRPMLQELADDEWILRPRVLDNLKRIAGCGLVFDILGFPRHLPYVTEALHRTPGLVAVVDHLAKPDIKSGSLEPWRETMSGIASLPDVFCKVSGLVTEAALDWSVADLRPYVDHVVQAFGANRLLFGSDWPVCTLAASYAEVVNAARTLLAPHFGPEQMDRVFRVNGALVYKLPDEE
jgi:L-fuconolactonase